MKSEMRVGGWLSNRMSTRLGLVHQPGASSNALRLSLRLEPAVAWVLGTTWFLMCAIGGTYALLSLYSRYPQITGAALPVYLLAWILVFFSGRAVLVRFFGELFDTSESTYDSLLASYALYLAEKGLLSEWEQALSSYLAAELHKLDLHETTTLHTLMRESASNSRHALLDQRRTYLYSLKKYKDKHSVNRTRPHDSLLTSTREQEPLTIARLPREDKLSTEYEAYDHTKEECPAEVPAGCY